MSSVVAVIQWKAVEIGRMDEGGFEMNMNQKFKSKKQTGQGGQHSF